MVSHRVHRGLSGWDNYWDLLNKSSQSNAKLNCKMDTNRYHNRNYHRNAGYNRNMHLAAKKHQLLLTLIYTTSLNDLNTKNLIICIISSKKDKILILN